VFRLPPPGALRDDYALLVNDSNDSTTGPIRLREKIPWNEIDGEIVLLDLKGSVYFSVKGSGTALWPFVVEGSTLDELTDCLAERFALDRSVAERDVRSFLDALNGEGLLESLRRS
jgi:hypothetical protein